ncbi:hypothetical protein M1271_05650 [Patescibacteria group bacterium]|nr:hypothetical protein [Patescibacteria group bacterium]MCL5797733.1 hypothetical protein [Patescibacteria group bacterium]
MEFNEGIFQNPPKRSVLLRKEAIHTDHLPFFDLSGVGNTRFETTGIMNFGIKEHYTYPASGRQAENKVIRVRSASLSNLGLDRSKLQSKGLSHFGEKLATVCLDAFKHNYSDVEDDVAWRIATNGNILENDKKYVKNLYVQALAERL